VPDPYLVQHLHVLAIYAVLNSRYRILISYSNCIGNCSCTHLRPDARVLLCTRSTSNPRSVSMLRALIQLHPSNALSSSRAVQRISPVSKYSCGLGSLHHSPLKNIFLRSIDTKGQWLIVWRKVCPRCLKEVSFIIHNILFETASSSTLR
jgi:hypothetical protein